MRGWNSNDSGLCALVHSQRLSLLLSSSSIQVILPYLSWDYEPGSQGIFIEEALYCVVLLRSLTLQVCSPPPALCSLAEQQNATVALSTIHHAAVLQYLLVIDGNDNLMLTIIMWSSISEVFWDFFLQNFRHKITFLKSPSPFYDFIL